CRNRRMKAEDEELPTGLLRLRNEHESAVRNSQAALATLPALMQLVQTFIRRAPPCGNLTRIDWRLGLNTRGVRLLACETLLPNCGPLPQTSQRLAMIVDLLLTRARCHSVDRREYLKRKLITND